MTGTGTMIGEALLETSFRSKRRFQYPNNLMDIPAWLKPLTLVRIENMIFREAAEVLGVPESTVKTRVRRGLLKLAE